MHSHSIRTANVWKRFRADRRRMMLKDSLQRLHGRLRGDPSIGWRWALSDISIEIPPGEAVGLVGSNGSGKSTLLKILNGVMFPYAGTVEVSGRVGALIEVRAGIHPELSGRENVHLYGGFLGLSRRDIDLRFDEIVEFAQVEDAIDRQVKFYSSGMQMRLGFAVASFLEPDVLLVDEVLAVGDASFQQRCLERMRQVRENGTTLVFVSHDLAAVEAMCTRAIWLDEGRVRSDGPASKTLKAYRDHVEAMAEERVHVEGRLKLSKVDLTEGGIPRSHGPIEIAMTVENKGGSVPGEVCIGVSEGTPMPIFVLRHVRSLGEGETELVCRIENLPLPAGTFYIWIGIFDRRGQNLLPWQPAARFDISGPTLDAPPRGIIRQAPIQVQASWHVGRPVS
jgi:ABC-type polysaccharide/polyol phosphate transport system ATPase subunit